jgi:hypothetical protein
MWFRRKSKADPAETIRGLRQHALTVSAADLGLGPTADRPQVWGVVMETGYPEAVATLVVLGEETTSLYFSNGGGVIGAGEHAAVRAAGEILLASAEQYLRWLHRDRGDAASKGGAGSVLPADVHGHIECQGQ